MSTIAERRGSLNEFCNGNLPSKEKARRVLIASRNYFLAFVLTAATTIVLAALSRVLELPNVASVYLVPVLIAAATLGIGPAVLAAVAGGAAAAFFFYPPIFSLQIDDPLQIIDLAMFICVAVVTGHFATRLRKQLELATQQEREMRQLHGELRMRFEMDLIRDAFIGSVSHELRTPLASILGAATVLTQTPAVAENYHAAALANVVRDEAERLNSDIQNLLDATRISGQGVQPRLEWVEPADVINSALERLQRRLANHRLDLEVHPDLPLVHTDPVMLGQALGQVLDNAIKYSPANSTIRVRAQNGPAEFGLDVADEGAGLLAEEKNRVWERFYRGERHLLSTSGSGLGLWIAQAFIMALGGQIHAESAGAGRGTTVSIRLPLQREPMNTADDVDE